MRRMPWAMVLWPGLARIYCQGAWQGLVWAVGFATLVNLALVASFVHPGLLPGSLSSLLWLAVAIAWLVGLGRPSACGPDGYRASRLDPDDRRFQAALDHYLRANWFEAEKTLKQLLEEEPRDLDARLMLATLYRHAGRLDEATEELEALRLFEGTRKWDFEIRREWKLVSEARARQAEQTPTPEQDPEGDEGGRPHVGAEASPEEPVRAA